MIRNYSLTPSNRYLLKSRAFFFPVLFFAPPGMWDLSGDCPAQFEYTLYVFRLLYAESVILREITLIAHTSTVAMRSLYVLVVVVA